MSTVLLLLPAIVGYIYIEYWYDPLYRRVLIYTGKHGNPARWSVPYVFDDNYYGSGAFLTEPGGVFERLGRFVIKRKIIKYCHSIEELVYEEARINNEYLSKYGYVEDGGCCVNRDTGLDHVSLVPECREKAIEKTVKTKRKNGTFELAAKKAWETKRVKGIDKIAVKKAWETKRVKGTDKISVKKMVKTRHKNGTYELGAKKAWETMRKRGTNEIAVKKISFTKGTPIQVVFKSLSITISSCTCAAKWIGVDDATIQKVAKTSTVSKKLSKLGITAIHYIDKSTVTWEDMFDIDSISFEEFLTTV